ncbi:MAG TPA: DNA gyrase inhibitor YacG [Candidatus Angelobacter sp.]|nr:DNA gyrase inhibitor YacG [Candidatus Angelobacter sp.]
MTQPKSIRCPSCRAVVHAADADFPFCSDRCRLIDLGKWASGGYVISTPIIDPEELESLRQKEQQSSRDPNDDLPSHKTQ